ncbi:hypothetical protein SAMN06269185_3334 [Natronoarchaeum philippinense]|uniref:DUF8115 domain-containing protein n=1 Tax=Natronoarchaeum philippinense TaxID=558529 RepID=A0A285PA85_NATPI|nr:hypothetical protein [Natronoarchaeum philippinense]SNZ18338.1 hypothetical protein SAMN06269185_3334 [Natronoarchaeum philippinense]
MPEDDDLATLKKQTSHGDRIDEAGAEEETRDFVEDIVSELEAIEAGQQQKTISVWDGHLAAFVRALEENPEQMENVGHALQQRLEMGQEEADRSEILRLALRVGFQEAAPEEFEAVREAVREQATNGL